MGNETIVTIKGHAGTVPAPRENGQGGRWARFRMCTTRSYRAPDGMWVDADPFWFTVKVDGALADRACSLVRKGTPLIVRGSLRDESWVDDAGQERHTPSIRAESIGVDIAGRGQVTYTPPPRDPEHRPAAQNGNATSPHEGFAAMGPVPTRVQPAGSEGEAGSTEPEQDPEQESETQEDDGRPF